MTFPNFPARGTVALLAALAGASLLPAQPVPAPAVLAPYVLSATRTPAEPLTLGSAVEQWSAAELARRQVAGLGAALGASAGTPAFAAGAPGAMTSLFLRGANSNQTLFLVDGLRLNDANTDYAVFLGGACVGACDSLEIAHGPQSTLYGGEAVGGVVALRAERGAGAPSGLVSAEAGSFGTRQARLAAQGERGVAAWNVTLQGGHTDNDRPNNAFDSANAVVRLDWKLGARVAAGTTLRWFHGVYGSPGDRYTNDPDNQEREENLLVTAFVDLRLAPRWTARAVVGGQDRRFVAESPRAGRPTAFTVVKNRRGVVDVQTTYAGWERHRVTGGVEGEAAHTRNTGFGDINRHQVRGAVFVQDEVSAGAGTSLTLGARNDDFDTFGRATTGRGTVAWQAVPGALKFRASYGTAFRSPSFLDLYGQSAFYHGNPDLAPERARGWDAGWDWYLPGRRGVVGVTWFDTRLTNLIASTRDFRSMENIQRARTRGAELTARVGWGPSMELRGGATWLEADNLSTGRRLLRRPRVRANADLWRDLGRGCSVGLGVATTAQREDVDARTFRTIDGEDYTVVRAHAAYALGGRWTLKLRIENLLGETYEEVNGYPQPGRGVFAGAEWRF
jgi:vitamin B12 transporter